MSQSQLEKKPEKHQVAFVGDASLPTKRCGEFRAVCMRSALDSGEHLALIKNAGGPLPCFSEQEPVLTRIQREHRIGDILGSEHFGSRRLITAALHAIDSDGRGVFVFIREGNRTAADEQSLISDLLIALGIKQVRLLQSITEPSVKPDIPGVDVVSLLPFEPEKPDEAVL